MMNRHKKIYPKIKNRASSRLFVKNRVSQVFWKPIKNRVSPRSVLLEAVYLEALLYKKELLQILTSKKWIEWPKWYFFTPGQSRTFGYENKAHFSGRPILSSRAVNC